MQVRLKVLQGSKAGSEIRIPGPECLIGRGDDCHLRTQSDAVSRRHCVIRSTESEVTVKDLGSRNGTFVNGEQVTAEAAVLLNGDRLRVGPLEFEVVAEQSVGKAKRPKVAGIKEVAARTAAAADSSGGGELNDVAGWLDEAEQAEKERRVADPETRQFHLDETSHNLPAPTGEEDGETKALDGSKRGEKKTPGKLPPRPSTSSKDSREAAADMLKKFFNRR